MEGWGVAVSVGLVVGRTDCETCGDDHFVIVCTACGYESNEYYPGGEPFTCDCGADVTPTVAQVSRWNVYEFDVLCDQHDDCKTNDALALACWKERNGGESK